MNAEETAKVCWALNGKGTGERKAPTADPYGDDGKIPL